mmetsp:Transcript_44828/g.117601  ORF Transcript_44828/g.117601 Transcript_44828/m.117601 type:complete len:84 (-) Transcript_44828:666-917(-)
MRPPWMKAEHHAEISSQAEGQARLRAAAVAGVQRHVGPLEVKGGEGRLFVRVVVEQLMLVRQQRVVAVGLPQAQLVGARRASS